MEFFSPRFFYFFLALVAIFPLLPGAWRRLYLTLASCLFYASWDWRYLGLLLLVSGIDYFAAGRIDRSPNHAQAKAWLLFSVASNLLILGYFKYANFFLSGVRTLGLTQMTQLEILLPAGISFYTFKSLSYTIDVYRRQLNPCKSWLDYALFVSFFPDLIAGPIVRASVFLPQLERVPAMSKSRWVAGLNIFLQGLTKKILIADRLAETADPVFQNPQAFSSETAWMGLVAFALQIYCDFSGYSDMAIATAHILGYDLPKNFDLPYVIRNLTELWQRWHITLSQWVRDYCFIPLGGSRSGALRTFFNLMTVSTLVGLWHGAGLNFLVWGALNGLALYVLHLSNKPGWPSLPAPLAWLCTIAFWLLSCLLFRSRDLEMAVQLGQRLVGIPTTAGQHIFPHWFLVCSLLILLGHLVTILTQKPNARPWLDKTLDWCGLEPVDLPLAGRYLCFSQPTVLAGFLVTMWIGLLFLFCATNRNPFVYFQF